MTHATRRTLQARHWLIPGVDRLEERALLVYGQLISNGLGPDLTRYLQQREPGLTLSDLARQILSRDVRERYEHPPTPPTAEAMERLRTQTLPGVLLAYRRYSEIWANYEPMSPTV